MLIHGILGVLEFTGTADIVTRQNGYMEQTPHPQSDYIRIRPEKKWSWGIDEPVLLSTN